jgi:hypothetical protein
MDLQALVLAVVFGKNLTPSKSATKAEPHDAETPADARFRRVATMPPTGADPGGGPK